MYWSLALAWLWACLLLLFSGCGPVLSTRTTTSLPRDGSPSARYDSRENSGSTEPWLIDWDAGRKVQLQSLAQSEIVLVRLERDDLVLLPGCGIKGRYTFRSTPPARGEEAFSSVSDIYAKVPIGAARLAADFRQGERWSLSYALWGSLNASVAEIDRAMVDERCASATHFVQAMVVGSYTLSTAAAAMTDESVTLPLADGGASHGDETRILRRDGDLDRCNALKSPEKDPRCLAVAKVFIAPIICAATSDSCSGKPVPVTELAEGPSLYAVLGHATLWPGIALLGFGGYSFYEANSHALDDYQRESWNRWGIIGTASGGLLALAGGIFFLVDYQSQQSDQVSYLITPTGLNILF